jgi:predicted GNAT superfamily acetyltransferase
MQSACVCPNVQIHVLENLVGATAKQSWKDRQDELLDQLFGKGYGLSARLPSPAEV